MNELLLDQIPVLNGMLRPLEELRLMKVNSATNMNTFIVQMIPELMDKMTRTQNWSSIIAYQVKHFFNPKNIDTKAEMEAMSDLYGYNMIEGLIEGFQCGFCKSKDASKRCSKCKSEWYCNRECQVRLKTENQL